MVIWRKTDTDTEKVYLDAGSAVDTFRWLLMKHTGMDENITRENIE